MGIGVRRASARRAAFYYRTASSSVAKMIVAPQSSTFLQLFASYSSANRQLMRVG